jgi:hypothetical protein
VSFMIFTASVRNILDTSSLFLSDFNENYTGMTDFRYNVKCHKMSQNSVTCGPRCLKRLEGREDTTNLIVEIRNFARRRPKR